MINPYNQRHMPCVRVNQRACRCAGIRAMRATSSTTASLTTATCVTTRAATMAQRQQPRLPRRSLQPGPSSPLQETCPGFSASSLILLALCESIMRCKCAMTG